MKNGSNGSHTPTFERERGNRRANKHLMPGETHCNKWQCPVCGGPEEYPARITSSPVFVPGLCCEHAWVGDEISGENWCDTCGASCLREDGVIVKYDAGIGVV